MQRILIVDDQDYCRVALGRLLRTHGFTIQLASGGFEALAMLDNFGPKIVILDLNMPGMDGYAFLKVARSSKNWPAYSVLREEGQATRAQGKDVFKNSIYFALGVISVSTSPQITRELPITSATARFSDGAAPQIIIPMIVQNHGARRRDGSPAS